MNRRTVNGISKRIYLFLMALLVFGAGFSESHAQEAWQAQTKEIVIVLDLSQSMKEVDGQYQTAEFIKELAATLPCTYQIGLIAYQDEIVLSLPIGSSYDDIDAALDQLEYKSYGNAGMGLEAAVDLFKSQQTDKQIIMISDGEIMMKTEELTKGSADLFAKATEKAKTEGIAINVLALGKQIEEGETIYSAASVTNGALYELENGESLRDFADEYAFKKMEVNARPIGKIDGGSGELQVRLPDCLMKKTKIILTGSQQNENLTVNCEADKLNILKGKHYTVIELENPISEEVTIQMSSEDVMNVTAYLMAEYEFDVSVSSTFDVNTQQSEIAIDLENSEGKNLLSGHLADGSLLILIDGEESQYRINNGEVFLYRQTPENEVVEIKLVFQDNFGVYLGENIINEEIILPEIEDSGPEIDWFFWGVIALFVAALILIFIYSKRKGKKTPARNRVIDDSRILPDDKLRKNDFYGKVQVYVIHNREGIDYPPESINLFARCNREVITLEWILDTCNLPLNLKGADKIVIKPGEDKSLIIKNSGRVTAMKGRELLEKGHAYHLYYHEKVTFIFDQEDTEIEVHYKDLKPNEK